MDSEEIFGLRTIIIIQLGIVIFKQQLTQEKKIELVFDFQFYHRKSCDKFTTIKCYLTIRLLLIELVNKIS